LTGRTWDGETLLCKLRVPNAITDSQVLVQCIEQVAEKLLRIVLLISSRAVNAVLSFFGEQSSPRHLP
jgi:hypothetical protein